jgi:hypothetical protein
MSKLRFVMKNVPDYPGALSGTVKRVLQQYGEIEQAPNSADGEGNPIYDGLTVEGWQDVPLVTTVDGEVKS